MARRSRMQGGPWARRFDRLVQVVSPRSAYTRLAYRMAYDALDGSRTRKPRSLIGGTGDTHLTEQALSDLREICRDHGRNNPIVKGILGTEATGVVGTQTRVEARSTNPAWNKKAEALWKAEMVDHPCDVTGRLNITKLLKLAFSTYRRDGDSFVVFNDDSLWLVEGDQCGTPYGTEGGDKFDVTNGVATRKRDGRVIGYYIGKPDRWGYIKSSDFGKYTADRVHHVFNPDRPSYTRGEPILTSAVDWIDKLTRYADAALVAANVQALFVMAITKRFPEGMLPTSRPTEASSETSDEGFKQEKLGAGLIYECGIGEDARTIAPSHPSAEFDPFVLRCLSFICRPLGLPLMLGTLDYSGATFMNARIAYQEARQTWEDEQNLVIAPLLSRIWQWKIRQWIEAGKLSDRRDAGAHDVICKRWPYIDPLKEAQADEKNLANGTDCKSDICARNGSDYEALVTKRVREKKIEEAAGLLPEPTDDPTPPSDEDTKDKEAA